MVQDLCLCRKVPQEPCDAAGSLPYAEDKRHISAQHRRARRSRSLEGRKAQVAMLVEEAVEEAMQVVQEANWEGAAVEAAAALVVCVGREAPVRKRRDGKSVRNPNSGHLVKSRIRRHRGTTRL